MRLMGQYRSRWEETNTFELLIVPRITDMWRNFVAFPKQTFLEQEAGSAVQIMQLLKMFLFQRLGVTL